MGEGGEWVGEWMEGEGGWVEGGGREGGYLYAYPMPPPPSEHYLMEVRSSPTHPPTHPPTYPPTYSPLP